MFESYIKLKNFSRIVLSNVSTVNIQPGLVLLPWLLECQMKTFLGEFWVPYWEEKIGVSNLEAAILCFLIWITYILQCFDLFQNCVWNCSFLLSLLRAMKTAGHSQSLNSAAFLFFSKLVAEIKERLLGEVAVMLFFPLQRYVRGYFAEVSHSCFVLWDVPEVLQDFPATFYP